MVTVARQASFDDLGRPLSEVTFVVLDLETTYADGTVRTSQAAGVVSVTVIYSAISQ